MVDGFASGGARHTDVGGEQLEPRVAAVELLDIIRPTTAVAWFLASSGHALIRWPEDRDRLASGDPVFAQAWAHEVRRYYPFAMDLYSRNHDAELWPDPYEFRPERFLGRETGEFELVPQGGGDARTGYRCPGEQLTVSLLSALAVRLARLSFDAPEQDLDIALHRIPARPDSGVLLDVR